VCLYPNLERSRKLCLAGLQNTLVAINTHKINQQNDRELFSNYCLRLGLEGTFILARARSFFKYALLRYRATTTRDGRQRLRRRCRQQTERERDEREEWDKFCLSLSHVLGVVLWWGVKRRTLSLISEWRRSIRGRSALILICHSIWKRSFVVEGGSFRRKEWEREGETEDDEFYFLAPNTSASFEDTEKKEKDGSFLTREKRERFSSHFVFSWPTSPSFFKNTDPKLTHS